MMFIISVLCCFSSAQQCPEGLPEQPLNLVALISGAVAQRYKSVRLLGRRHCSVCVLVSLGQAQRRPQFKKPLLLFWSVFSLALSACLTNASVYALPSPGFGGSWVPVPRVSFGRLWLRNRRNVRASDQAQQDVRLFRSLHIFHSHNYRPLSIASKSGTCCLSFV